MRFICTAFRCINKYTRKFGLAMKRRNAMLKRTVMALFAALFVTGLVGNLTACNTVHGMGQDLERGGEKIQREADKH